jgi:hypothetical protein
VRLLCRIIRNLIKYYGKKKILDGTQDGINGCEAFIVLSLFQPSLHWYNKKMKKIFLNKICYLILFLLTGIITSSAQTSSQRGQVTANYENTKLNLSQKRESRITRLILTYNSGNNKLKAREHKSSADDEKDRVKGWS